MAQSGTHEDKRFAEGFLEELRHCTGLSLPDDLSHWRPFADLGSPRGSVFGDLGVVLGIGSDQARALLIVEREGSGPGNERSILKWWQALRSSAEIRLKRDTETMSLPGDVNDIFVALVFGRSAGWQSSDFDKTIAFCSDLAQLATVDLWNRRCRGAFNVTSSPGAVEDWNGFGKQLCSPIVKAMQSWAMKQGDLTSG